MIKHVGSFVWGFLTYLLILALGLEPTWKIIMLCIGVIILDQLIDLGIELYRYRQSRIDP